MHAMFLTFEFAGEDDELDRAFSQYAESLVDVPGLLTRTWMKDGSTVGGFFVFQNVDGAEQFLGSARIRSLVRHPNVSDFYVRHFSTLGTISAALPHNAAALHVAPSPSGEACAMWQAEIDSVVTQLV